MRKNVSSPCPAAQGSRTRAGRVAAVRFAAIRSDSRTFRCPTSITLQSARPTQGQTEAQAEGYQWRGRRRRSYLPRGILIPLPRAGRRKQPATRRPNMSIDPELMITDEIELNVEELEQVAAPGLLVACD